MSDHSLYSIQNDILVAIKKILRNLKIERACNKTQNYFEKHEHDLETLWKDFCTNHEKLKTEGKDSKRDLYFKSGTFSVAEGVYKTTRDKLYKMHQYYKLTKFPSEGHGSSHKDIQQEKQEIEECMDGDHLDMETEINPVKLLENSDVATISDSAVIDMGESNNGVEFMSVELLLNELSAQTRAASKTEVKDEQQKRTKPNENIDLSILQVLDERPGRKVRCPFKGCSTQLSTKERMVRHIRVHNGEMPFQCNHCDYATYNSTRIQEHINTHSGVKPYKCNFCKYSSVSKKYIKQHEAKHRQCDCGFISKNSTNLLKHQEENCPFAKEKDPNTLYTCKHCKKKFATRYSSRTHRQGRGLCSICNDFVCGLTSHMSESHGVTDEVKISEDVKAKTYKFVCNVCGWKGGRESRVLLHLIHHPQAVGDDIDVSILKKYNIL